MKRGGLIILIVIIAVVFFAIDILYFNAVVNSNMPDWLKWMILKG